MDTTGLLGFLRRNPAYGRLWLAGFVSFFGDWFTIVALVRYLGDETQGRLAVGGLFAAQALPALLFGSVAGSTADRVPRRTVMIACDLLRAAGTLAFLAPSRLGLEGAAFVAWILTWVGFQHSVGVFFRPACSSSVPALVGFSDLTFAGTLDGLSWSLGLIAGSAMGGVAVDHLGLDACILIDSATFLASAAMLRTLPLPRSAAAPSDRRRPRLADYGELLTEVSRDRRLVAPLLAKCAWGVGAAQLLLLTTFGDRLLGAAAPSTGFGLLYAARGLGTACGPAFARRILGESDRALIATIGSGFALAAAFYGIFGLTPPGAAALVCVAAAHAGGSMVWIGSTVLLQRRTPDRIRGRAFALELSLHTLTAAAAPLLAAALLDRGWLPEHLVLLFAGLTALLGSLWLLLARRGGAAAARPLP